MGHKSRKPAAMMAACLASCVMSTATAQSLAGAKDASAVSERAAAAVGRAFEAKTGLRAERVVKSPVPGLHAVYSAGQVFYVDDSGRWLLEGRLVDLAAAEPASASRSVSSRAGEGLDLARLSLSDSIRLSSFGDRRRTLIVFADPNCGYCKRLDRQLEQLADVNIFVFPVAFLGEASARKSAQIWCSSDQVLAWARALRDAEIAPARSCDASAVQRNTRLAREIGIRGTPTIFFADGTRLVGYADARSIERRMAQVVGSIPN